MMLTLSDDYQMWSDMEHSHYYYCTSYIVHHTSVNLARVFANVLKEFGIMDKVSLYAETEVKYF